MRTHGCGGSLDCLRRALIALVVPMVAAAATWGAGCTRANPAYQGAYDGAVDDVSASGDGAADAPAPTDTKPDVAAERAPDTGTIDTKADTKVDTKADTKADVGDGGDGGFVCVTVADCTARSAPACGTWECRAGACVLNCPNCTDGDGDGYGVGTGCAGLDCDDADPAVHDTFATARNCPAGTVLKGTCHPGSQTCTAGIWSTCSGQVRPSGEACNGEDDDCDGTADNNLPAMTFTCGQGACLNTVVSCSSGMLTTCIAHVNTTMDDSTCDNTDNDCDGVVDQNCATEIANCIHVSPNGDDTGDGSTNFPLQTIPTAIATAFLSTPPKPVCVAGGPTCQDRTTYKVGDGSTAPAKLFQMANGVSVYGNYESNGWTRCTPAAGAPDPTVTIELGEGGGVRFPSSISLPTALDGFVLTRKPTGTAPAQISAVTVNGAKQAQLSNLIVNDAPSAMRTYGVNVAGGQVQIIHSLIIGGAGTAESYGVHSVNSTLKIQENCLAISPTTGRCTTDCSGTLALGIGGRVGAATTGISGAVLLSTSQGTLIDTSTLCGAQGAQAYGVHIIGDATGTVIHGSSITAAAGAAISLGILAEDCTSATPWIVGNQLIQGQGTLRAAGILARGTCDPVIDGNILITGGGDSTTNEADGVACETNMANEASQCAVLGNWNIKGSSSNAHPLLSAGVACRDGACGHVASNVVSGTSGKNVVGVLLGNAGVMVEQNQITGGCGDTSAMGILADDAFARVQNNLISAGTCTTALAVTPLNIGVRVLGNNDPNEMDVDSNTIDGGGNTLSVCTSTAVELGVGTSVTKTAPVAPKGMIRNNILRGGVCSILPTGSTSSAPRTDFSEARATTDPRLFKNNDLDPGTPPTTLYLDEGTTIKTTADAINGLTDITTGGNITVNPAFVSTTDLHLGTSSMCKGAGTPTGAPLTDFDGNPRGSPPSIGAYE